MLYFAIPLKPRRLARDWATVSAHFRCTLASILRQTDPRFRVLVAATDLPDAALDDPRIELLHVPACEQDPRRGHLDKRDRILAMAHHVRKNGGGVLMPVDADDLVSRRLAAFLNAHPQADGFVAQLGLELDQRTGRLRLCPKFWNICGTSIAIRFRPDELPADLSSELRSHLLSRSHHLWAGMLRARGKRVRSFPLIPSVYRIHTGENLSILARGGHGWKRDWLRRLTPSFRPPRALAFEFGL